MQHIHDKKSCAIQFRKEGKTYREILSVVDVAKSTLSIWLRDVHLSKRQKQTLSLKKKHAQEKGAQARHVQGVQNRTDEIKRGEILGKQSNIDHLLHIGMALYWAEGVKEKPYKPGSQFVILNMDPRLILVMRRWLQSAMNVPEEDIVYEIYVHEQVSIPLDEIKKYWSSKARIQIEKLEKIRLKRHNSKTNRRNTSASYFGILKLSVKRSSWLVRRVEGWVRGLVS